ncbi:MAG: AP-4 complex subunit epsilon-1 [Monoraphidium minutum]|nr:MAG: AP-4 complex subunit epsilon-1 [Monoraphidium minutum]
MLPQIKGLARDVSNMKVGFRELDNLVKAIGECKSKAEEDRIILAELETLKQRLSDPRLDRSRGREYMVRVMYCEMLGHDASFAYIPCLQFASDSNLLTKKAAYLALSQLLDYTHELVLLLVNTLLSDLKSDNYVVVCSGLVTATKLIGPDLVNAVYPVVVSRLGHPKEAVRKKAVMALHHFIRLDPHRTGALAGQDVDKHLRTALCDKDPSVMCAALCALQELASIDPAPYRSLIPSITSILKQVAEHRLPKSYDYHRFPAPFIQIKLLRVLAKLGAGDKAASDNMAAVVGGALKKAGGGQTIGNAIVYEAVRTITAIYPSPQLLAAAAEAVTGLLRSPSHNLRYVGLDALAGITRISPKYAVEHQVAVIDCLEDPDDTLKLKTLELLATMTKANNVQVIVERLMLYLKGCTDEHVRRDIATKVCTLAERYAPDTTWFISTMAEVFELGGDTLPPSVAHNLMRLIAEQEESVQATAVSIFMRLLDRPAGRPLPATLLHTVCWVLGEYGRLAAGLAPPERATLAQVMDRLCAAVAASRPAPAARAYLLTALTKLAAAGGGRLTPEGEELVARGAGAVDVELQQRAREARALLSTPGLAAAALPPDASCEELDASDLDAARSLSFLSSYVDAAAAAGAAPYNPPPGLAGAGSGDLGADLEALGTAGGGSGGGGGGTHHTLRFDAYEPAAPPAGGVAAARIGGAGGGGGDLLGVGGGAAGGGAATAAAAAVYAQQQAAAAAAAAQQQQGPQLTLRAGGPRRWGPAEFGAGGAPAAAGAAPAQQQQQQQQPAARGPSPGAGARQNAERDRLAASLFGDAGGGGSSGGARPAARSPAPPPPAAALIGDLLGDDEPPPPAPAAAAAAGPSGGSSGGGGLDLLMDLGDAPAAPSGAPSYAAAAPAAAALGGLDDLLGGPVGGGGGGGGGPLGGMGPSAASQQQWQAQQLAAVAGGGGGAAPPARPLMPGAMGAMGSKGGAAPAKAPVAASALDPFKDLLG